jgi:glycosyltransferase involved in cell wall biosynthesis
MGNPQKRIRLAILHPDLHVRGGAENVVVWLADALVKRNYEVSVFSAGYSETLFGPLAARGWKFCELGEVGRSFHPQSWKRLGAKLAPQLEQFDIINPHNFPSYIWAYWAKRYQSFPRPIIWYCEEPYRDFYQGCIDEHCRQLAGRDANQDSFLSDLRSLANEILMGSWESMQARLLRIRGRWMDQRVVPRLDGVLTNSYFVARNVERVFHRKAEVCYLGLPLGSNSVGGANQAGEFTCTVSRLYPEKNVEGVVKAISLLVDQGSFKGLHHYIIGDGPQRESLELMVRQLGLERIVEFKGFVSDKDLDDYYRRCRLVVYTPLDETFGLIFLEAGLRRKPVIAPNHGGPTEVVEDGVNGFLVDPLEPRSIAEGIFRLLQDKNSAHALGDEGYRRVTSNFSFDSFVDRFEQKLAEIFLFQEEGG